MFYNRDQEQKELAAILEMEPSLMYLVYGPMNSGKTTLITHVLDQNTDRFIPFYINFRGRNIESGNDFLHILFDVDWRLYCDSLTGYVEEYIKSGALDRGRQRGVPISGDMFDLIFNKHDKGTDAFQYMEQFFSLLMNAVDRVPIIVLDEIQLLRSMDLDPPNALLDRLVNFFVRLTKGVHKCHCMIVSSDSMFLQRIRDHAGLEGRYQGVFLDDLDKPRAMEIYQQFGFTDRQRVWSYIGGKIGDMVMLKSWLNRGYDQTESLERMLRNEVGRLEMIESRLLEKNQQECAVMMDFLYHVGRKGQVDFKAKSDSRKVRFWSDQRVMFLEPEMRLVKPQGQLVRRAIHAMEGT